MQRPAPCPHVAARASGQPDGHAVRRHQQRSTRRPRARLDVHYCRMSDGYSHPLGLGIGREPTISTVCAPEKWPLYSLPSISIVGSEAGRGLHSSNWQLPDERRIRPWVLPPTSSRAGAGGSCPACLCAPARRGGRWRQSPLSRTTNALAAPGQPVDRRAALWCTFDFGLRFGAISSFSFSEFGPSGSRSCLRLRPPSGGSGSSRWLWGTRKRAGRHANCRGGTSHGKPPPCSESRCPHQAASGAVVTHARRLVQRLADACAAPGPGPGRPPTVWPPA